MSSSDKLGYISLELPGLGGVIKAEPAHFVVREIPLYEPCGEGPHLYLTIERAGFTTREMTAKLAKIFSAPENEIGYAGLKDKEAVTVQTFSLPLTASEASIRERCEGQGWRLLGVKAHKNKLKQGHLLGNGFEIIVSEMPRLDIDLARQVAILIQQRGLPNYFGPQRFGHEGANVEKGLALLKSRRPIKGWRDKLLLSALQSHLYNRYLANRLELGLFQKIMPGDICKKYDTGGLFASIDQTGDQIRFDERLISHTGPMFGRKMMAPDSEAGALEADTLTAFGVNDLGRAGEGDRRLNRLLVEDLTIEEISNNGGLRFCFSLPKGAYATTLLREFLKND